MVLLRHAALAAILCAVAAAAAKPAATCAELGFNSFLLCSDCDQLSTHVQDEELVAECRKCCAEDSVKEAATYSSAVLECPRSLRSYPHIDEFVSKKAEAFFPALSVRYRLGSPPRLVLQGPQGGGDPQVVDISQWKTEHVEEYLKDKLRPAPAAEANTAAVAEAVRAARVVDEL